MANILVTGGAGFIGSHTCKELAHAGHTPITYDNLSRGNRSAVRWGPLIKGSLHDREKLLKTLKESRIEGVIHFAAYAYVGESTIYPEMYFDNNVKGTLNLLNAMEETGVECLIFSSSCATYGEAQKEVIDENHPQRPINPYGLSKLMVEEILSQRAAQNRLRFCALRYFNGAGADPDLEIGENHNPEPHIIPNIIKAALQKSPLYLNGRDYPTPDGTCIRDSIHVTDLASAHRLTLERLLDKKTSYSFYNLGSRQGFSLLELVKQTESVLGKKVEFQWRKRRPGDPAKLIASSHRFTNEFPWQTRHSDLQTIIKTAATWLQKNIRP